MLTRLLTLLGGYAVQRRDLRLLLAAVFLSFLGSSITFPLRLLYAQAHHASPIELGLMAASFMVAPLITQVPAGWLVDHWGRIPMLWVGLVMHPILSLLYIWLVTPHELIALRFLEGVSVAAITPAVAAYITDVTPEQHRTEAFGGLSATLNAGMLIGPLVGGIIGQSFGFITAFLVNVAIEVLAIPLLLTLPEPRTHETHQLQTYHWRQLFALPLVLLYLASFAMKSVFGVLGSLWSIWVHDLGGSYTYIGLTFTVFALPQIILGAQAGRVADRWGRAPFLLVSGIAAGLIYAAYGVVTSLAVIMLLGLIEGIVILFQTPVAQGLLADASPPRGRGSAQGIFGAAGSVGGAVAAFASLPLYHFSRPLPFAAAGLMMMVGGAIATLAAVLYGRRLRARALEAVAEPA